MISCHATTKCMHFELTVTDTDYSHRERYCTNIGTHTTASVDKRADVGILADKFCAGSVAQCALR